MKSYRLLKATLICILTLALTPIAVMAEQVINDESSVLQNDSQFIARAESTGYIYKTMDGIRYKRLWSYSRGCWIDPTWTPC